MELLDAQVLKTAAAHGLALPETQMAATKPLPELLRYLWEIFCQLSAARSSNGFGPNPIGFADIDACQRVMQIPITPWEARVIRKIDTAFIEAWATAAEAKRNRK